MKLASKVSLQSRPYFLLSACGVVVSHPGHLWNPLGCENTDFVVLRGICGELVLTITLVENFADITIWSTPCVSSTKMSALFNNLFAQWHRRHNSWEWQPFCPSNQKWVGKSLAFCCDRIFECRHSDRFMIVVVNTFILRVKEIQCRFAIMQPSLHN